jgi:hypothetical protein
MNLLLNKIKLIETTKLKRYCDNELWAWGLVCHTLGIDLVVSK